MKHDISYISPIKHTFERLFGIKEWYILKECTNINTWKKECKKCLNASIVAIRETVLIADSDWVTEANRILNDGIDSIESFESIDEILSILSSTYIQLSFHQLGFMPRRGNRNVTINKKYWKLGSFRSVQYVQTENQKADINRVRSERKNTIVNILP